ncbi:uncharacterized protein [Rutidosis leptorrhynchoides]|uniref:uncharacterized protein n=1 Tax=Rutidosis leptorrhynchoides TaxID=125765 RepID=UPI003A9A23B2
MSSENSGDENDVNIDSSDTSVKKMSSASETGVKSNGNNRIGSRRSVRSSNSKYRETDLQESSSSYHFNPPNEYSKRVQNTNTTEVEDDQDELLRKLDELRDQILRSRDKSKEKVPMHHQHHHIPSYNEAPPYANMHPLLPNSNQVQVFTDPFRSQNPRRNPIMPVDQNPYHTYYSGEQYELTDHRLFHHPSCSCMVCYNKHQPPPPLLPPIMQNDQVFYRHDYNRRFSNLSMNSNHSDESHSPYSNALRRPPRGILAAGGRRCHPMAGGSPFVACCNCYELIQVPKKNTKKMRCASCSSVMLLSFVNKRLVLSVYTETNKEIEKSVNVRKNHGNSKCGGTEFSSEDYDNSGSYDFKSMDKLPLGDPSLTFEKSALSFGLQDDVKVNIIEDSNPGDVNKPTPPPTGSPLQDHFDYSTKFNRAGKGNVSKRSNMEIMENSEGLTGSSMKDAAVASEIEISSNEYCVNTGTSLESGDATDLRKGFVGKIKKSFRELSRSSQHVDEVKVNVTVNGHPITDRLVKQAENLAGPIAPGDYWYDLRAGFWGMIGGPCRGIIPPFIEEFDYPMPENCADGNTNVFVNGRELHQRDLDLLASRGLSTETDRSYVIEISGKVFDEDSGLELEGLGKLAPTVEREKQGFGMKPPRTVVV